MYVLWWWWWWCYQIALGLYISALGYSWRIDEFSSYQSAYQVMLIFISRYLFAIYLLRTFRLFCIEYDRYSSGHETTYPYYYLLSSYPNNHHNNNHLYLQPSTYLSICFICPAFYHTIYYATLHDTIDTIRYDILTATATTA